MSDYYGGLQEGIEGRLEKRTKGVYAPPGGKFLICFLDDVNMPKKSVVRPSVHPSFRPSFRPPLKNPNYTETIWITLWNGQAPCLLFKLGKVPGEPIRAKLG
jgi:hypothetical protein